MATAPPQADSQGLLLQLLDPANRADPYRLYARFRDIGPLQLPRSNVAVFSAYRDCDEVLRHPSSSSDNMKSTVTKRQLEAGVAAPRQFPPGFLFLDPPDHTRLRKLVSKAFAPKVVNALQSDIGALVGGLLDRIAENGRFDVVADFAYPLPVAVICRLLGVPLDDEPHFSHASSVLALLRNPVHWTALGADPGRASLIVEETLRYDPPVQLVGRVAAEDMTIGAVDLPAGDIVMLLLAAAQRDPAEYGRPDTFDPDRGTLRHLGFGHGVHYCLGAPLARLEAGVALSAVAARFPHARLDSEPQYKPNVTLRGLSELTVAI